MTQITAALVTNMLVTLQFWPSMAEASSMLISFEMSVPLFTRSFCRCNSQSLQRAFGRQIAIVDSIGLTSQLVG